MVRSLIVIVKKKTNNAQLCVLLLSKPSNTHLSSGDLLAHYNC